MNRAFAFIVLIALTTFGVGGCRSAGGGSSAFTVPRGSYGATFDAAKEAVRRLGFGLERVDARSGVIRTDAVSTAGLATPWTKTETSFQQEIDSFLHRDERRVEISFETTAAADSDDPAGVDFRSASGDLVCRVRAIKTRQYRPGLRLSTTAVRLSSVQGDRTASEGEPPQEIKRFAGEDEGLARRLVVRILKALDKGRVSTRSGD